MQTNIIKTNKNNKTNKTIKKNILKNKTYY